MLLEIVRNNKLMETLVMLWDINYFYFAKKQTKNKKKQKISKPQVQ